MSLTRSDGKRDLIALILMAAFSASACKPLTQKDAEDLADKMAEDAGSETACVTSTAVIDQNVQNSTWGLAVGYDVDAAQSFTLNVAAKLDKVSVKFGYDSNYPAAPDTYAEIRTQKDTLCSGQPCPSDTVIATSESVLGTLINPHHSSEHVEYKFPQPVDLEANHPYWIVIMIPAAQTGSGMVMSHSSNNSYAGGQWARKYSFESNFGAASGDLVFKVFTCDAQ